VDNPAVRDRLDAALARVGATPTELLAQGGSVLSAGAGYLVGSLAQGLGNAASDIDIHIFLPELARPSPPYLFFLGTTPVDVEHYPAGDPARMLGSLATVVAPTPLGDVAHVAVLSRAARTCLTRWCTAMPLRPEYPPIFDEPARALITAHLLRSALSRTMHAWATAALVAEADLDFEYALRQCGKAILDMAVVAAGVLPAGDKWLPARMRLADLPAELIDAVTAVRTSEDIASIVDGLGLVVPDPLAVTRLGRDPDAPEVRIGRKVFVLTRFGQLHPRPPTLDGVDGQSAPSGSCRDLLAERPATELVALVAAGVLRLDLDEDALSTALERHHGGRAI